MLSKGRLVAEVIGGGGVGGGEGVGLTYVLHSPLQNGVYLCIQGLDSLLA